MSKFLTYEERLMIAQGLKDHKSFGAIAKELSKDRTTIAKEIKRHSAEKKSGRSGYPYNACLFDVRNIDLPRKVKYRSRYKKPEFKIDRGCRIGRNYQDFQKFTEEQPEFPVVQMDSVIGNKGGKVLLTPRFVDASLMLSFLRDANFTVCH